EGATAYIDADVLDPESVLADAAKTPRRVRARVEQPTPGRAARTTAIGLRRTTLRPDVVHPGRPRAASLSESLHREPRPPHR
ncbi:hypothetical protein ABZ177_25930, partial [Streptomyces sp. NPDC006284]|uniref:hypothetical protein n=1 Tax=Streptomyces sp. NPDC006284 TaxID=3156742 RepID=UPI0033A32385